MVGTDDSTELWQHPDFRIPIFSWFESIIEIICSRSLAIYLLQIKMSFERVSKFTLQLSPPPLLRTCPIKIIWSPRLDLLDSFWHQKNCPNVLVISHFREFSAKSVWIGFYRIFGDYFVPYNWVRSDFKSKIGHLITFSRGLLLFYL